MDDAIKARMNREDVEETFNSDPLPDISVWTLLRGLASAVVLAFAWLVILAAIAGFVYTLIAGVRYFHL